MPESKVELLNMASDTLIRDLHFERLRFFFSSSSSSSLFCFLALFSISPFSWVLSLFLRAAAGLVVADEKQV